MVNQGLIPQRLRVVKDVTMRQHEPEDLLYNNAFAQTGSRCEFFVLGTFDIPPAISAYGRRYRCQMLRSTRGQQPRGRGQIMTIKTNIAASIAGLALLGTSAFAADIITKAPKKVEAAPASCFDLAFGGGIQSDYNFRGVSQIGQGPERLRLCRAALQHHQGHPALRRHLGLEHQAADLPDWRVRPLRRYPADLRQVRLRLRRHVLLLPERDAAIHRSAWATVDQRTSRLRPSRQGHRLLGSLRQADLDCDRLARH